MSVTQIVGNYCSVLEETSKVRKKFGENLPLLQYGSRLVFFIKSYLLLQL